MKNSTQFSECSPIFVVGASRSGTTLLQLLLNAHPSISISGELHYFNAILRLKEVIPSIARNSDLQFFFHYLKKVTSLQYLPNIEKILEAVKTRLENEAYCSYEKFYKYVLEEYAKTKETASRFGEKTPENVRYLDHLIGIFPNAKIIHIVRDPRDVVLSMLKVPWTANDVVINTLKWKCDILCGQAFSSKAPSSYLEVRYEDLVLNSEEKLTTICAFIEEKYDCRMLEFHQESRSQIKDEPWKEGTFSPVNPSSIGKWRAELPKARVFIVEAIAGKAFSKIGYQKSKTNLIAYISAPVVFVFELFNYILYKVKEARLRRKNDPDKIFGETKKLHDLFFKLILGR